MKITISGTAAAFDRASKDEITQPKLLKKLDGIVYEDDNCCEYLDGPLANVGLIGGLLRIAYDADSKKLRVVTEYHSPRRLKPAELKALAKETAAQWSDGIGENYFWQDVRPGVTIEMLPRGADGDLRAEQIDDGVKVPPKRFSPLCKAAEAGDMDKIKKLLAKGEDINARDKRGKPVLQAALWKGQMDTAMFLLEQGADVHGIDASKYEPNRQTALHVVCAAANDDASLTLIRALLAKGADVNAIDSWGQTPLFWANLDQARLLLEHGANVNHRDTHKYNEGHTPLMHTNWPAKIEFLLAHGADVNNRNERGLTAYEYALFQAGDFPRTSSYERWMPAAEAHLAAIHARAKAGDAASQFTLAEYHDRGLKMPKNPAEAFRGFERSAKNGYRLALLHLGICYRDGNGTTADVKKALAYFRKAADVGVPLAMGILGECYAEGKGVAKDLGEAVNWFRRGADLDPEQAKPSEIFAFRNGVGACRAELGACYDEGKGIAKDPQEALRWYQAALDIGFHHVQPAIEKLQQVPKK